MLYKIVDGVFILTAQTPLDGRKLAGLERDAEGQGIAELSGEDVDPPTLSIPMRKREAAKQGGKGRGSKPPDASEESPPSSEMFPPTTTQAATAQ